MSSLSGCHCGKEKQLFDLSSKHDEPALDQDECICEENQTLAFFNEINSIHEARLKLLEQETNQSDVYELKVETLKKWIDDLTEQNSMLIETVTQLEQEACKRVHLLESKLRQSATTAYEYVAKVQEFNNQTESMNIKNNVQDESLRCRMLNLENDVLNLLELIHRVRETGSWNTNGLQFTEVTTEDIFGTNLPNDNETYQDLKNISNLPEESKSSGFLLVRNLRQELDEMKRQLYLKDKQILEVLKKFQHLRDNLSETSSKVTYMIKQGQGNTDSENNLLNKFKDISDNINTKTNIISPQFLKNSKNIDQTVEENEQRLQLISLKKQLTVSEDRYHCLLANKNELEQEIGLVKRNLERALDESTDLNKQLEDKDKYTRDIRLALTSEVADKHDQIINLRKDLQLLEEQCRRAEMQTLFKDDIIRELRKELKIAKAKLSLIERGSGDKSRNPKEKESIIEPERLDRNSNGEPQKNSEQKSSAFQNHINQNSFENNKIYDNRNSFSSKRKKLQVLYGTEDLNQAKKKFLKKRSLSAPAKCRKEMAKPILRQRSLLNPSINGNEIVHKEDLRVSFVNKNMDDEYNEMKEKYEKISKENQNLLKEMEKIKNESLNINDKEALIEEKNILENTLIQTTSIYNQELSKRDREIASMKYSNEKAQNDLEYTQNEIAKYQKRFEMISKENETFQLENSNLLQRIENQQKQMINQRTTIGNLQQALLMTKNQLEDIQSKDVSGWGWSLNSGTGGNRHPVHDV